jgi:hypothetical protein
MSVKVTVELPDELARKAQSVASQTRRRFEDVLLEWLGRAGAEPPIESLPDDQIMDLCSGQMETGQQEELGDLLARNREGQLDESKRGRLDELMGVYRRGLLRKAQALKTAVDHGLRPRLQITS